MRLNFAYFDVLQAASGHPRLSVKVARETTRSTDVQYIVKRSTIGF